MHIAVIGLGLIGGSAVRALAAAGHRVLGYDADPTIRAAARTAAALAPVWARWQVPGTMDDAVAAADIVIVAVPLPGVGEVFDQLAASGFSGVITDVTSVKGEVRRLAGDRLPPGSRFVGGHPMAGRETSGFASSDATLFQDCAWVLCLEPGETSLASWLDLAAALTGLGARVVPSTAADHDAAVAGVSHVPHLLATALAATVAENPLALALGAGSFRDGTRVAATRPELVAAMCGGNAAAVLDSLDAVLADLTAARHALTTPDPVAALTGWLGRGHRVRRGWPPRTGLSSVVPATAEALNSLGGQGGWITAVAPDRTTLTVLRPRGRRPATDVRPGPDESPGAR